MQEPEDAHIWGFLGFVIVLLQYSERKTDLGSEVPSHAQQGILGGVDVAGTSEPHIILAPSSEPHILAPSSISRSVAPTSEPWISASSSEPS